MHLLTWCESVNRIGVDSVGEKSFYQLKTSVENVENSFLKGSHKKLKTLLINYKKLCKFNIECIFRILIPKKAVFGSHFYHSLLYAVSQSKTLNSYRVRKHGNVFSICCNTQAIVFVFIQAVRT